MSGQGRNDLDPIVIEQYKQAHENRRRWEGYIWQWGIILTVLAGLFAGFGQSVANQTRAPQVSQRFVLTLVTAFVFAIAFNVWRARHLMKVLERALMDFHTSIGHTEVPTVPRELDARYPPRMKVSSTLVGFICHTAACAVFVYLTISAWV